MLKRFTCMILSLVLLVGLIPAAAIQVSAASNATSSSAITILKKLETFSDHCWVGNGYLGYGIGYTGYGTKCTETGTHGLVVSGHNHLEKYGIECDDNDTIINVDFAMDTALTDNTDRWNSLPEQYKTVLSGVSGVKTFVLNNWGALVGKTCPIADGNCGYTYKYNHTIRETEADTALRAALKEIDTAINSFASKKGISLSQNQHDALAIFSFENGTAWMQGTDDLQNAVVNGTYGQAFVNVLTGWGGNADRRKVEANIYLNGVYNTSASALKVTETDANDTEYDYVDDYRVTCTVTNAYINVRQKASIYGTKIGTVYSGDTIHIVRGSVTEANGYRWGLALDTNYDEIGYVALMYTSYDDVMAADSYQTQVEASTTSSVMGSATVKVNGYVNVRSGAGTKNPIVSSLRNGVTVDLYEIQYVNGQAWGKTTVGWFSLAYAPGYKVTNSSKVETNAYGYLNYQFTGTNGKTFTASTTETDVKKGTATFTTITEVTVRAAASIGAARNNTLAKGTEIDITKVVSDGNTIWGYADDIKVGNNKYQGWIDLSTQYVTRNGVELKTETADSDAYAWVATIINCVEVNVRSKASVYGTKVATVPAGTVVEVYDGPVGGTAKTGWYQVNVTNSSGTESWVRGDYLDVRDGTKGEITYGKTATSPSGTQAATGQGMVANTYGGVNVRTAPGTANAKVTKLLPGTVVDILEVSYYGSTKWGRIEQGWVCMDYIAMMDYDDLPGTTTTVTSTQAVYEGKAVGYQEIYKEADRSSSVVRSVDGDTLTVHELLTVTEVISDDGTTTTTTKSYWARVNDGYILNPANSISLNALYEETYTVTGTELLKVREAAGTDAAREDKDLNKYDQVKITELEIVGDQIWGKFEDDDLGADGEGWICLSYCTKGAVSSESSSTGTESSGSVSGTVTTPVTMSTGNTGVGTYSGKIIGSAQVQEVNVRKEPSTTSEKVTDLKKGTAITITETRLVDGRSWGYCGSGWINLLYVDLTPVGITAIDAKVIAVDNTLVYESYETGANVVGSYANRAVVNIYEEMNGMYKTDMGWISKGNCL